MRESKKPFTRPDHPLAISPPNEFNLERRRVLPHHGCRWCTCVAKSGSVSPRLTYVAQAASLSALITCSLKETILCATMVRFGGSLARPTYKTDLLAVAGHAR